MIKEKVAIITGGTRGIGYETVKLFAKNGATVILFGSKKETVDNAINKLKEENLNVYGYYPNLNNYDEVEQVINEINNKFGHIDILVNNAGISANKIIDETDYSEFEKIINLNVNAMFSVTKAVVPYMKKQKEGVI